MPLDTARLHLRRPVEQDADAIIAIVGDWEVARRLARVPHPYTHADVRSGRVLAKLGFTPVGTSSRPCLAEGKDKAAVEVEWVP
jgi:RimJ/RimL family protein N-acetyltransferase